jgi:hypothetical protein
MNLMQSMTAPAWASWLKPVTSKCCFCHRSLALKNVSSHKAGITMQEMWYCSSPCLTSAAKKEVSRLLQSKPVRGPQISRMPLGLSLMSRGVLTRTQYQEALDEQKRTGGDLGELVVSKGWISESQVTAVIAAKWGCAAFTVPTFVADSGIHIPLTILKVNSAVPLHYVASTNLLLIGFVHGVSYGLLSAIEQITECKTQPCFVTPSEFKAEMGRLQRERALFGESSWKEVVSNEVHTPTEIAQALCGYCVDFEAEEVIIRRCNEFIWVRLKASLVKADLLFKAV